MSLLSERTLHRTVPTINGLGVNQMRLTTVLFVACIVSSLHALAAEKHDEAEQQAPVAADSWLALVDDGKYAESWDAAAEYLKNAVAKDDFAKSLNAAHK